MLFHFLEQLIVTIVILINCVLCSTTACVVSRVTVMTIVKGLSVGPTWDNIIGFCANLLLLIYIDIRYYSSVI